MAHINLLPWRETLRKEKKQEFFTIVALAAGAMLAVLGGVHVYMASLIDNQIARNDILKNEIKLVEKKIDEIKTLEKQKEQLIARMQVIEKLQSDRPAVVHLFDELARIVPEGLYIERMNQKDALLTIEGNAQSNARVSAFMRSLDESDWFKSPVLDEIVSQERNARSERKFKLVVKQDSPKGDEK